MRFPKVCAAVGLWCLSAQGFVAYVNDRGQVLRWNLAAPSLLVHTNVVNRQTRAVRYFIASDAFSSANRTAELNAVRACFAQWQSVPGAILKFEESGFAGSGIDINPADNTNVVFWAKQSTLVYGGRDDIRDRRGYTVTASLADNTLLEADIVLNGVDYAWQTDLSNTISPEPFIEASLLHEIGHFIGLDHSPVGGATVTFGGDGYSTELGLSSDDVAAVRALYPHASIPAALGYLRGRVLMNSTGVFGAMVTAEDRAGNAIAGTVSRLNGIYELPALPPGDFQIRVAPLDPAGADELSSLMRGRDIALDYDNAETSFLPTTNRLVSLTAGRTNTLDFTVRKGEPVFRIAAISHPSDHPDVDSAYRWAGFIRPGQSNLFVGVSSTTVPTNGATLTVTGDGLTVGPTLFKPNRFFGGQHLLSVSISVASNATPGLRSFIVQQGTNLAYANGYLEVLPPFPDFNFDGLDDTFQRRFFPLFTVPGAAPQEDPDGDGFNNLHEYRTGSDPTNALSLHFRIETVTVTQAGTTLVWQSAPGKRFQVFSRRDVAGGPWEALGAPVTAQGSTTQFLDASATNQIQFYRVQALP